jgi:UMF1 family MFS transporter
VVRLSFIITAVFFALSTVPLFLIFEEKAKPQPMKTGENYATIAFKRLGHTIKSVRNYREFIKFMVAFLIYNDGILAALDFAAILGAVLFGMTQQQLIIFMIIVQVTSVIGAYVYGLVGERFGFKTGLVQSLVLMILTVAAIFFNTTLTGFFIIGAVAGFALTAVQSLSRTMIGAFAPPGQSAEFYGFFAVAGRTSSFIGPTLFGIFAAEATQWYLKSGLSQVMAEQQGHRLAVWSIVAFLVVGLASLALVNEKEGRKVAQQKVVTEMVE